MISKNFTRFVAIFGIQGKKGVQVSEFCMILSRPIFIFSKIVESSKLLILDFRTLSKGFSKFHPSLKNVFFLFQSLTLLGIFCFQMIGVFSWLESGTFSFVSTREYPEGFQLYLKFASIMFDFRLFYQTTRSSLIIKIYSTNGLFFVQNSFTRCQAS